MNNNLIKIISALVIGVVIGFMIPQGMSTTSLDKTKIEKVISEDLLQGQAKAKVESFGKSLNVVETKININGQKDSIYISNNGKVYFQKIMDLEEIEKAKKEAEEAKKYTLEVKEVISEAKELAKKNNVVFTKKAEINNDKPKVELFVMSYCPFGTQAEKGYLPAVEKLGDKINTKVKFVNYVMHPSQNEGEENFLQYCIQETQPEKYNAYLGCFLEAGKTEECVRTNNIDLKTVGACLNDTDNKFAVSDNLKDKSKWLNGRFPKFNVQDDLNKKYGVQGSPTLVINGQKIENVGRDANSMFKAICSAFKVQPEVCKEELSKESPSSGFGYDNSGVQNNTQAGCGA